MKEITLKNHCPVCSGNRFSQYLQTRDFFYTMEEFTLLKCNACNFVLTHPLPEDISRYYDTPDYLSHNTSDNGILGKLYSKLRNINIKRKYSLVSSFKNNGSILDIGCGTGELLDYFNLNKWTVTGIEPNESARKYAVDKYKINVLKEEKLDELQAGSFDVVSMWHVLEHVPDLNHRLSQINRLLKNDGTVFIALPNLDSPDAQKYKEYWSALDVPRHLYHFTQNTFEQLVANHSLKLVHAEPMKFDSYYVSMLSEKYRKNPLYMPTAFVQGLLSNIKARKNNSYSSMIFVVKKV